MILHLFNYVFCICEFVYLVIFFTFVFFFIIILLVLMILFTFIYLFIYIYIWFSEFQEQKTKLSELYLANGSSESKSSAAQRIVGFLNSLTNFLNPDANFVPQERVKALKVLRTLCFYTQIRWQIFLLFFCLLVV